LTTKDKFTKGLPSKEELRQYILDHPGVLNKREIARAFGIKGQDQMSLRRLLREMTEEGSVEKTRKRSYGAPDALPDMSMIEIIGLDADGEMRAKPVDWQGKGKPPDIYVLDKKRSEGYLSEGDQILVRLKRLDADKYEARILKAPAEATGRIIGVFKPHKDGGYVHPTDKKIKQEYFVPPAFVKGLSDGDLVVAEPLPAAPGLPSSRNPVRIVQHLGKKDDPRLISLIAIHSHGIPTEFSKEALAEAETMEEPDLSGGRVDIRHLPLVTIDGADARDFDDAVFAEPDTDPKNPGGWHLIVAIADVSFYVRSTSALGKIAFERGNSTYFADRVVPMLPERLSNDLCSLRPKVNRACLAAHLWIDAEAKMIGHKFFRGLMRSAARLTYEQVEDAHKGHPDDTTGPLIEPVIKPLYKVYSLLKHARELRGALEIDLPERKAIIDAKGQVTAIIPRQRLESHQLIEEFMILANVAAAETLEEKKAPCVYRVHPPPAYDKLEATREFLKEFGYSLPKAEHLHPRNVNRILKLSAEGPDKALVHTVLLRTQSPAVYSPDNLGHFGLALERYAHFTSPIRRYADLIVHRALVKAHRLGEGGLGPDEADSLHDISEHISVTERRSMIAERDAMDRFTAQYLSANIGKEFAGKISGVTHFGLFVNLDESGADGLVPMRALPGDFYIHDEKRHALVGKRSGRTYRLAAPVIVRLKEADPLRGSTVFEIVDGTAPESSGRSASRSSSRSSPRSRSEKDGKKSKHRRGGGRGNKKR
jgi:ribonuclease R